MPRDIEPEILEEMVTNKGQTLLSLSNEKPILLIFLRHFGCVFCKEALSDLAEMRTSIEAKGVELVFVHMAKNALADRYFEEFDLKGALHISDPNKMYYIDFGLRKGNFSQLYGLSTWLRGFSADVKQFELERSPQLGDSTQMPGIFSIKNGTITGEYIHKKASDKPNYEQLIRTFFD